MGRLRKVIGPLILALLVLWAVSACAQSFQTDIDGIDKAARSVLMLEVYNGKDQMIATGSGFVAFDNYTLVTNHHVMEDAAWILAVNDAGNQYMVSKVIAADAQKDIALLEFFSPTDLEPLALAVESGPRRAEPVVAISSPKGVTNSVSMGNISALYEEEGVSYIQFTAPISYGSSGGALFNSGGEVIGITTGAFIDGQNMNLAVDISEVIRLHVKSAGNARIKLGNYQTKATALPTPKSTATPSPSPTAKPTPKPTLKPTLVPTLKPIPTTRLTPTPTMAMPKNVKATAVVNGVIITWSFDANVEKNSVYRSASLGDCFVLIGSTTNNRYLDSNLEPGVYFYKVQSVKGKNSTKLPDSAVAIEYGYTLSPDQTIPCNIKTKATAKNVTVTWTAVKNADSYIVYRSYYPDGPRYVMASVTANKFVDTKVFPGENYYYEVRSIIGVDISEVSNRVIAKMPKPTPTPKPTKTPKPTPTPYKEPKYPIQFGNNGYIELYQGYPQLNPGIKNISGKKTVDGFTLTYYCENVYREKIKRYGYSDYYCSFTYAKKIAPGKSSYPGYVWLDGYSGAKYVHVAITKIHTTDGKTITIPESEWQFYYWTIE